MMTPERFKITRWPLFMITLRGFITRVVRGAPDIHDKHPTYITHIEKRAEKVKLHYYKARSNNSTSDLVEEINTLEKKLKVLEESSSPHASERMSIVQAEIDSKISAINSIDNRVDAGRSEIVSAFLSGYYFGVMPRQDLEVIQNEET